VSQLRAVLHSREKDATGVLVSHLSNDRCGAGPELIIPWSWVRVPAGPLDKVKALARTGAVSLIDGGRSCTKGVPQVVPPETLDPRLAQRALPGAGVDGAYRLAFEGVDLDLPRFPGQFQA